jgi:hypothetical protein
MIRWLYRYVFRGIGIVFIAGIVTILLLSAGFRGCSSKRAHDPSLKRSRAAKAARNRHYIKHREDHHVSEAS